MVTVIVQEEWCVRKDITHRAAVGREPYTTNFWYELWVFPTETPRIDSINYDYLVQRVELDVRSAMSGSYSYQGHTWNPVDAGKYTGFIYNIPTIATDYPYNYTDNTGALVPNGAGRTGFYEPFLYRIGSSSNPPIKIWGHYIQEFYGWTSERFSFTYVYHDWLYPVTFRFTITTGWGTHGNSDHRYFIPNMGAPYYHYDRYDLTGYYEGRQKVTFITDMPIKRGNLKPQHGVSAGTFADAEGKYIPFYVYGHDTVESLSSQFRFLCSSQALTWYFSGKSPEFLFNPRTNWVVPTPIRGTEGSPSFRPPSISAVFPDEHYRNVNWKELAAKAYASARFSDINGIAGIQDVLAFGSSVTAFQKSVQGLAGRRLKSAAQLYLSVHYGFKLFLADLLELEETLEIQSRRRSSLSKLTGSSSFSMQGNLYTARYQVFYDQFAKVRSLVDQALQISDVQLTLENWWDSVPFSFVLDWFVGIGDVLSKIDDYANLTQNHDVICCGKSMKGTRLLSGRDAHLSAGWTTSGLSMSRYLRWYYDRLELPSLIPSVTTNLPFNHSVEGAALIISRK